MVLIENLQPFSGGVNVNVLFMQRNKIKNRDATRKMDVLFGFMPISDC